VVFQFESLADFANMAGHGPYVWASYAVTVIALLALVMVPTIKQRQLLSRIERQQCRESQQHQEHP